MPKITIPTKNNLDPERGTIILSISDFIKEENMHLLTLGNMNLYLDAGEDTHLLKLNKNTEQLSTLEFSIKEIDVIFSWEDNQVWLSLYSKDLLPEVIGSIEPINRKVTFNNILSLVEDKHFNGVYQRLSIYSQPFESLELGPFNLEVFEESTEKLFEADFTQATHYERAVVLEDTFAPTDGSPIIVSDDEGVMERQFFFDEKTGEYGRSVTEYFVYLNQEYEILSYENVELDHKPLLKATIDGIETLLYYKEDFDISNGRLVFLFSNETKEAFYGAECEITYQISRSYNIDFNEDVPHDGFRVNLTNLKATKYGEVYNSTEDVRILKEGNRFENEYLAREIELNPLVNPQVQGFMYIDTSQQFTQAFRIRASSQYLNGNGVDSASVIIEAIDEEGNEVLSPYLSVAIMDDKGDITTAFGNIEPIIGQQSLKARNTSGRAYYQFKAPVLIDTARVTHKIYIIAVDRKTGVGAQYPIFIQSVQEIQTIQATNKTNENIEIPFEYFARMFERPLPENHPLIIFDQNENKQLDRKDFQYFKKQIQEKDLMSSLTEELLELEREREIERNTWLKFKDEIWFPYRNMTWEDIIEL